MCEATVTLGRRIRHRRRVLNLTQSQVGAAVGVRFQQIQKYESGVNDISVTRLLQIATALEIKPGELLDGLAP